MNALIKLGYDGAVIEEAGDSPQFVAFSPNQIKSVFNSGT
jgi:hypothetical protein